MRVPRKIKKAVKNVERYSRPSTSGFWIIPYEEFFARGRSTKWKQKCINKIRRERRKMLLEKWQHFNGNILMH